ncbi:hypothetical protein [Archangium primigenium]|uniref:hypothetical protein n=1 Tax=[Archangium] primigenium TaxID=2792470 RepID=UPI0019567F19|nr:hypothetical protein [Archangium primigenium]MBM7112467.1 hypothetical protein [Archangium primigenium]
MNDAYTYPFWNNPAPSSPSAEQRVSMLARQEELEISLTEAHWLLEDDRYQVHFGIGSGRHYRKPRSNGCYHLRIDGTRAFIHWDEWDPRRHPIEHFFETPVLWGSALAIAVGTWLLSSNDND